ncbi:hypothetical protein [Mycolicibacterium fluoranthenivorans]|uniref:DUF4345 domain-containing protein n=1 Tax=Mycolicibacterium fluoranthenivorans TaxID=258505 RepID=A0A7X5U0M2_9MYCO|nr:hypothetical protein [Mycolicibacterium fluoranthenivorans]NIH96211.1 hypothetical protein [Mycolicibacterium fluoranthenivorans]
MKGPRLIDLGLVAAMAASAIAHARLYLHGYRFIPVVGPGFLVLTAVLGALAILILAGGPAWTRVVAAMVSAGALVAFVLSRTIGFFGFAEHGWEPQPYAVVSVVAEVVVMALGFMTLRRPVRGLSPSLRSPR